MSIRYEQFDPGRIKALREFRRMSHDEFGKHIGKSKQTIISWEKGRTVPDANDFHRIAKVFDVPIASLWVLLETAKA